MMKRIPILLGCLLLLTTISQSQIKRETRAVWLSTNFKLDWPPPTFDEGEQKSALIEIFDNLQKKNINTVYFQVRSNATLFYTSAIEPFTPYLTGKTNVPPSYDPLKFAIAEAHKRGLEIHAWFNVVRCFSGSDAEISNYENHIINKHKDWVYKKWTDGKPAFWLDPGKPEVREYLKNLIVEVVQKYEVDGIHLDFIRYPVGGIEDDETFRTYGNNPDKADWRRENINSIVRSVYRESKKANPKVKIGATPVGIYKNTKIVKGLQGYHDVYQDAQGWLKEGIVDYIVPQIYWDFENNPKFDVVAKDWLNNSSGRNVILGIASYRDDIKKETEKMISLSRKEGAAGIAFFRYTNIKNEKFYSFEEIAFPSGMEWVDNIYPNPPINLKSSTIDEGKYQLNWSLPEIKNGGSDINHFSIYSLPENNSLFINAELFYLSHSLNTSLTFSITQPQRINYYFSIKSVDKLWNESSSSSNIVQLTIPELKMVSENVRSSNKPVLVGMSKQQWYLTLNSHIEQSVIITLRLSDGKEEEKTFPLAIGDNIIELNIKSSEPKFIELIFSGENRREKLVL